MKCRWCGKDNRRPSDWEQQGLRDNLWHRLCVRCANRRLGNPWNGLLPMRRIAAQQAPSGVARPADPD